MNKDASPRSVGPLANRVSGVEIVDVVSGQSFFCELRGTEIRDAGLHPPRKDLWRAADRGTSRLTRLNTAD
ncbi:hypothetical protein MesoLj113a_45170 [Mesorhizobium sp. 113-1-2]|nr:hypothetical protein MesoLj113a_45170 [Mesorhizobium sp. 113-1-2]